jgi:hypothetical protein
MTVSSMSRIGWYSDKIVISVPSRSREVRLAAAASIRCGDPVMASGVPWCSVRW